jgi:hypothetical protein
MHTHDMNTIENPPIPFFHPLYGGFPLHAEVILSGASYNGSRRSFAINLRAAADDVALHVNPRFGHYGEHTIVLNSYERDEWKREERHSNPMRIGDQFRIRIVNHEAHFLIELNDRERFHFTHRLSAGAITRLDVEGDVSLQRVQLIGLNTVSRQYPPAPYANVGLPAPSAPITRTFMGGSTSYGAPTPNVIEVGNNFSAPRPNAAEVGVSFPQPNASCGCSNAPYCHHSPSPGWR